MWRTVWAMHCSLLKSVWTCALRTGARFCWGTFRFPMILITRKILLIRVSFLYWFDFFLTFLIIVWAHFDHLVSYLASSVVLHETFILLFLSLSQCFCVFISKIKLLSLVFIVTVWKVNAVTLCLGCHWRLTCAVSVSLSFWIFLLI